MLLYDRNIIGPSSEIFGKCPKNVRKRSSFLRNNFGKSSEIFGKASKTSSLVCLYNKQNITCLLVDMNYIFSCSTWHLTPSLRSLLRWSKVNLRLKYSVAVQCIYFCYSTVSSSEFVFFVISRYVGHKTRDLKATSFFLKTWGDFPIIKWSNTAQAADFSPNKTKYPN